MTPLLLLAPALMTLAMSVVPGPPDDPPSHDTAHEPPIMPRDEDQEQDDEGPQQADEPFTADGQVNTALWMWLFAIKNANADSSIHSRIGLILL